MLGPALALLTFMLGAAIGGRSLRKRSKGWSRTTTVMLVVVGILMVVMAVLLLAVGDTPPRAVALPVTGGLGLVMGMQAATARKVAVADVTTVVVTSTITGFAADSRFGGGHNQPWFRRAAAIVLIAAGAGVGALLLMVHIGLGVALAAVIVLACALLGQLGHRPSVS